jgi:hypothetical protein
VQCQQLAKKLIRQCATISDEPVILLDLSLAIHNLQAKKKLLIAISLSIESSLCSEEGGGDQQTTLELLNKTFSAKFTQCVRFRRQNQEKWPTLACIGRKFIRKQIYWTGKAGQK